MRRTGRDDEREAYEQQDMNHLDGEHLNGIDTHLLGDETLQIGLEHAEV
jgi:hypothetical protein